MPRFCETLSELMMIIGPGGAVSETTNATRAGRDARGLLVSFFVFC